MRTNVIKTAKSVVIVLLTLVLLLSLITTVSVPAFAADMTTEAYTVYVDVKKDNTYKVTEQIDVNFNAQKHGIYRYIPMGNYKDMGYMKIKKADVKDWEYTTYEESGNYVIRVGSEDETVSGPQRYVLNYNVVIYEDRDEKRDFFYFDVIPTDWETAIDKAYVTVKMPKKVKKSDITVYSGSYGSQNKDSVKWGYDSSKKEIFIEGTNLRQGQGVTILCEMEEGYWVGEKTYGWAKTAAIIVGTIIPVLIAVAWFFFGRDKKIIPTVEFYPPEGMNPAEVGYIIDRTINKEDLVSLIMYYADKGYVEIEQVSKDDFVIHKLKDMGGNEKNYVQTIFRGLFANHRDSIALSELDEEFGERYETAYEQLYNSFMKKSNQQVSVISQILQLLAMLFLWIGQGFIIGFATWYSANYVAMFAAIAAFIISIISLIVLTIQNKNMYVATGISKIVGGALGWVVKILTTAIFSFAIAAMFGSMWMALFFGILIFVGEIGTVLMVQRTKKSIELMGKILGLKNFIEKAELDRINKLVEENPNYFYSVLPYAYVMGLTDKWAKNFENIPMTGPSWYRSTYGGYDAFDVWYISRAMDRCGRSFKDNIHIPMSDDSGSGGGGFSSGGGGFSGGGFGGGGGGSW
ncbi:MAG: DUF2207 domain-containing protein [Firmicutes bacterium]|nr:DUF2207 domain-containing protein [Bacillota bacterium]